MKKRILALLLALAAAFGLLTGCLSAEMEYTYTPAEKEASLDQGSSAGTPAGGPDADRTVPEPGGAAKTEPEAPVEPGRGAGADRTAAETAPSEPETPEETAAPFTVDEDGEYTAPEDVAEYLYAYGHLPGNFITKKEAQALGWPGGDLWKYAPGKSIGGDYFGNYEGLLPKDARYRECDVNYAGGRRGAERVIYGDDGSIYYTDDHYASFTQLY